MANDSNRQPCRLLVVDDEAIVGKRLKQVFGKIGFHIESFTEPAAAVAAMSANPFDIVVTDLKMEGMDGLQVAQRTLAVNPAARVIIITGYASPETAEAARDCGVFAFLAKPFRLDELKEIIVRAMAAGGRDESAGR
ncbi:MAG: response regulator [Thermodesulfobacteriota bacterium]